MYLSSNAVYNNLVNSQRVVPLTGFVAVSPLMEINSQEQNTHATDWNMSTL
jgi:hypothetical protein